MIEVRFVNDHSSAEFGEHKAGDVVEMEDHLAHRLVEAGEAVETARPAAEEPAAPAEEPASAPEPPPPPPAPRS